MIRLDAWIAMFGAMGLLWYECGDDFGLFCYRISCGAFTKVRSRALGSHPDRKQCQELP
jgi:hypothetical protein